VVGKDIPSSIALPVAIVNVQRRLPGL